LSTLPDTVRAFLTKLNPAGATVIAAVSGGPDSVALVRALALVRVSLGLKQIVIAHLNHQLRGEEGDRDAAFVRDLYKQIAADDPAAFLLREESVNIPVLARERKEGIEATARAVRYAWLARLAGECAARWVATGHTANDQAETVLHRLLRGTGLKGLRGIPEQRPLAPGVTVIRPLLQTTRQEVLEFLSGLGQSCCLDTSNADTRFFRNRLRCELLPLLAEHYNAAIVPVLCQLAHQASEVGNHLEEQSRQLLREAELPRAGAMLVFDRDRLVAAPRLLIREMFRRVWDREQWPQQAMGFQEWERTAAVTVDEAAAVDLPGQIRVRRCGKVIQVFKVS
jgi:tRNA(Ile)-lysidine synthase